MARRVLPLALIVGLALLVVGASLSRLPAEEEIRVGFCWPDLPFDGRMQGALAIVTGKITGLGAPVLTKAQDGSGQQDITTPVFLVVEEALKGNFETGEVITFRQFGGRVGRTAILYSDAVTFIPGEHVLVALYQADGEMAVATSGEAHAGEGKYLIGLDGIARHSWRPEASSLADLKARITAAIGR